jgi:PAS domain S-box-containing protein
VSPPDNLPSRNSYHAEDAPSLEFTLEPDGTLRNGAFLALSPALVAALQRPEFGAVRERAIERGESQHCAVSEGGVQFNLDVVASDERLDGQPRLHCRVVASEEPGASSDAIAEDPGILADLPLAITVADRTGTILYANRSAHRLVGIAKGTSVVGTRVWDFVHPTGLDEAHERGWMARQGRMARYERHLLKRTDGSVVPVETTTSRVSWKGEPAILVASHDLSGMESVERALEDSQRLFSSAFHTAPVAIMVSRIVDGKFVDVNQTFLRYVGRSREQTVGRELSELGVAYDREAVESLRTRVVDGDDAAPSAEVELTDPTGRTYVLLCTACEIEVGGESCMLTSAIDITELHRAAHAVQESERRFRLMADAAPVLIWVASGTQDRTFVNRQWLEFVGRALKEEVGGGWTDNVHPEDLEECMSAYRDAFAGGTPFSIEYRLRRHDGDYRWMLDRGAPNHESDGRFAGFIGSCVDITDRRVAEERLRDAKERAEQMTILKSAFLTNMTHEIRTPLTVILGFTSILRQGTRREYQRFVTLIERSGRRLLLMLDSILDLAQLEAGTLEPEMGRFGVAEIVHGVVGTLEPVAKDKGISLDVHDPPAALYAHTDPSVLTRVLNNLIDNAIKFTDSGTVRIRFSENEGQATIHIEDTGVGIHEEFLPRIFDAFAQESTGLTRSHQGAGLGLTVSRQLLDLIGGNLTVSSRKDVGSHVTIGVPLQP